MKKMSKLFSLAMATILSLCLCSFGMTWQVGADPTVDTIVISPSGNAYTLADQTYTAYKVFAATVSGSSDTSAYTYTIDGECMQLSNGTYTFNTINYTPEYLSNDDSSSGGLSKETKARNFANELYNNYLASGKSIPNSSVHSTNTDIDSDASTITLSVAGHSGYYLVVGTVKTNDGKDSIVQSLAILDTSSNQRGVTVNPKVQLPTITDDGKKARKSGESDFSQVVDSELGDVLEYRVGVVVPNTTGYSDYKLDIVDTKSNDLTYDGNSIALYVGNNDNGNNTNTLAKGTESNQYWTSTINGNELKVTIDVKKAIEDGKVSAGNDIYMYYNATVSNTSATYVIKSNDDGNQLKNTVHLSYPNNPYTTTKSDTPDFEALDYTYGVEVDKYTLEGSTEVFLHGAEFQILADNNVSGTPLYFVNKGNAAAPVWKLSKESNEVGRTQTISVGDNSNSNTSKGKLTVYGFDGNKTYYLHETKAPDGYQKIDALIPFTIVPTYSTTNNNKLSVATSGDVISALTFNETDSDYVSYVKTANESLKIKIKNTGGQKLVGTGGIGTTIFYVGGGILMVGAAVLLVTKLRMRNK